MVVEDDFEVTQMEKILEALRLVPPDWDILRFDCYGEVPKTFPWPNRFTFRTTHAQTIPLAENPCSGYATADNCWFCGGTHVMLWHGHAVQKLRAGWSRKVRCFPSSPFTSSSSIFCTCALHVLP